MKKFQKAFTLIEMLIVVVIIGILAAALVPRLTAVQGRARDTKTKADLSQIVSALAVYKSDVQDSTFMALSGAFHTQSGVLVNALASGSSVMTKIPERTNGLTFITSGGTIPNSAYGFMTASRNGANAAAVVLMSPQETDGASSNWVIAGSNTQLQSGSVNTGASNYENTCSSVKFAAATAFTAGGACTADRNASNSVLRYVTSL